MNENQHLHTSYLYPMDGSEDVESAVVRTRAAVFDALERTRRQGTGLAVAIEVRIEPTQGVEG